MGKGSLLPENQVGGAIIPDGDYKIKSATAQMFDYGGKADPVPALCIVYEGGDTEYSQNYSAGKGSRLVDDKTFENIGKTSNLGLWINAILTAGFPVAMIDDDVTVFVGASVTVTNVAQQKRPGLKDQVEGKTIPLVSKVLALPGKGKAATSASSAPAKSKSASTASANGGGALDAEAQAAVVTALATSPDGLTRGKLSTLVLTTLAKSKDPNMVAIKKLAGDSAWLVANAEEGGWTTDGETITLG